MGKLVTPFSHGRVLLTEFDAYLFSADFDCLAELLILGLLPLSISSPSGFVSDLPLLILSAVVTRLALALTFWESDPTVTEAVLLSFDELAAVPILHSLDTVLYPPAAQY